MLWYSFGRGSVAVDPGGRFLLGASFHVGKI